MGLHSRFGDESKAVGCVSPTALPSEQAAQYKISKTKFAISMIAVTQLQRGLTLSLFVVTRKPLDLHGQASMSANDPKRTLALLSRL